MRAYLDHAWIFVFNYEWNSFYDVVGDSVLFNPWVKKPPNSSKLKHMSMSYEKTKNHVLKAILEFVGSLRRRSEEKKENMRELLETSCGSVQMMVMID
ncbi:unnamed protein product [Caenorhabditis nigoni]